MTSEIAPQKSIAKPHSLDEWTQVLCNEEMPIFSNTALSIQEILNNDRKGVVELASVIMQDPNLTVKLLKISNSSYYNPTRQKIVTVSRAIIIIGSEVIRALTLACSFLECILSANNKQQVNEEIAQAIHAATQAKSIAIAANDISPEEVFIAALLNRIGEIAFWCFCGEQGERILALIKKEHCSHKEAEKQVLGFKLAELGASLSKVWELGGLIGASINPSVLSKNPRVGLVMLGYEITEALKEGGDSKEYEACVRKIEALTKQPKEVIAENLKNNTSVASDIARQFGATDAAMLIQLHLNQSVAPVPEQLPLFFDKKQLQLRISRDIVSIISDPFDINQLMEMVLDGIYRGIGMDRAVFFLLAEDKQTHKSSLRESLYMGWRNEVNGRKVIFNIPETPPNIFFHALSGTQVFWAKPSVPAALYRPQYFNVMGNNECFIMPLFSQKKPIGLIYADRGSSGQPLTKEDFDAFKYFSQQANIGFILYPLQGKKG